ncbi:MAG TPA: class I SAM-dependent methyltransferase [Acidimicrobiia bacterium]
MTRLSADELVDHALEAPFRGWDFSALGDRIVLDPPPWRFEELVDGEAARARSMLDMGTGGGEWLSMREHARLTVATESWSPNVPVAAARLRGLGVALVHDEGARDNAEQSLHEPRGRLAFRRGAFDLVVNRHESFVALEVRRVLRDSGVFITQQAGSGAGDFHELLGLDPPSDSDFHIELAAEQLERAGLRVEQSEVGPATTVFADIGALAWYLTNVPWAVSDFSVERHREALLRLHGGGPIRVVSERFWLRARVDG